VIYLYIVGGILLMVAAASLFLAFQRPDFIAGLVKAAVSAIASALLPAIARRKSSEEEAKDRQDYREGKIDKTITGREREH
jgi:uncharacterized membrane protein YvlD (DUF360 family)